MDFFFCLKSFIYTFFFNKGKIRTNICWDIQNVTEQKLRITSCNYTPVFCISFYALGICCFWLAESYNFFKVQF